MTETTDPGSGEVTLPEWVDVDGVRRRTDGHAFLRPEAAFSRLRRDDVRAEGLGSGPTPGKALHGALCRAAGVVPGDFGAVTSAARFLGLSGATYDRMLNRRPRGPRRDGLTSSAFVLARDLGVVLIAWPDGPWEAVGLGYAARNVQATGAGASILSGRS